MSLTNPSPFERERLAVPPPDNMLFDSEIGGVTISVPPAKFIILPGQHVIAPYDSAPDGEEAHIGKLPFEEQMVIATTAQFCMRRTTRLIAAGQRVIQLTDGNGVKTHAHTTLAIAQPKQGGNFYTPDPELDDLTRDEYYNWTLENLAFQPEEVDRLNLILDIAKYSFRDL